MKPPSASLADRQAAFMRAILDEDAPLPDGWGNSHTLGLSVYRGNYRSALMGALASSFERTARYVGADAFRQAGINHLIARPPAHWTIDAAGEGFDLTCAQLFRDNSEVAELAWLEWTMLQLASAPDTASLSPQDFGAASAAFGDAEWMGLRLTFQPRATGRIVNHDLAIVWRALAAAQDAPHSAAQPGEKPHGCLAWREGERPTFQLVDPANARAFAAMQDGACYGDLIELLAGDRPDAAAIESAAHLAGAMLGLWLKEGMVIGIDA